MRQLEDGLWDRVRRRDRADSALPADGRGGAHPRAWLGYGYTEVIGG